MKDTENDNNKLRAELSECKKTLTMTEDQEVVITKLKKQIRDLEQSVCSISVRNHATVGDGRAC